VSNIRNGLLHKYRVQTVLRIHTEKYIIPSTMDRLPYCSKHSSILYVYDEVQYVILYPVLCTVLQYTFRWPDDQLQYMVSHTTVRHASCTGRTSYRRMTRGRRMTGYFAEESSSKRKTLIIASSLSSVESNLKFDRRTEMNPLAVSTFQ
jgi:hypothetical protein